MLDITEEEKNEYLAYHTPSDVIDNLCNGILEIKRNKLIDEHKYCILICGAMMGFDKGISNFMNKMYEKEKSLFFLSEVTAEMRRYTDEVCKIPHICTPHLLAKEILITGMDIPISSEADNLICRKTYLKEAENNLYLRHPNLGNGYARMWTYLAYKYVVVLIDRLRPIRVVLWNEFYALHHIIQGYCAEKNIKLDYMEFGCIPGTFCIESHGQQGESDIARHWLSFRCKYVNEKEISYAGNVLGYLKKTGLNRNIQPPYTVKDISLNHYKCNRKTLLYLGQNDFESGLQPYNKKSFRYHSPIFKSTFEALEFLAILCIKNDLNLIFKPHPIMQALGHNTDNEYCNYDVVDQVDINSVIDISDIVVTILSQGAYIGLIREKPILMIGYSQLKHKGCVYEAYDLRKIEKKIKNAIKFGYTIKQKKCFNKHVAQLLKYYLYDDEGERSCRYGRRVERDFKLL